MLFVVTGSFTRESWNAAKGQIKSRKKKAEVKIIIELMTPGDRRFTGIYDSKDATSLYKYLTHFEGLEVGNVAPALPIDNLVIIDEMAKRPDAGNAGE